MEQFKPAVRYGVIMGVVSVLVFLVMYAIDPVIFAKTSGWIMMLGINFLAIPIVFIILSMRDTKVNFTFFSFGDALKAGMTTAVVSSLIVLAFNVVFTTLIDTEWEQMVLDETLNTTEEMMENMGTPQEVIDESMEQAREKIETTPRGVMQQVKGTIGGLIWYVILSLIIGAIYRDKKENLVPEINDLGE